MATQGTDATLEIFASERCSAILRTKHADKVAPAMEAAVEGGFRIVEFTLNTPDALEHIQAFASRDGLVVGAGTVLTVDEAEAAVEAGARFLVSPVTDPEVIAWAARHGIVAVPGAATPTEALAAHRAGAHLVKVFPGPAGGPGWVRAVRGPLPFLRLFPTSGVELDNAAAFLEAGAFGVGFVNCLFRPQWIAEGRFGAIRDHAREMVAAVRAAS